MLTFRGSVVIPYYFPWSPRNTQCSNAAEIDCTQMLSSLTCRDYVAVWVLRGTDRQRISAAQRWITCGRKNVDLRQIKSRLVWSLLRLARVIVLLSGAINVQRRWIRYILVYCVSYAGMLHYFITNMYILCRCCFHSRGFAGGFRATTKSPSNYGSLRWRFLYDRW